MEATYVDIHIHTSENPDNLNENYDVETLVKKVRNIANENFLIALSDHNVINKKAYLRLLGLTKNVLLAVELHIKKSEEKSPYHCHIIFNVKEINEEVIDSINDKLGDLYPKKVIYPNIDKIPSIDSIIEIFKDYDFMLLPHGGQSHSTFNNAIDKDAKLDTVIEKSIYYNQFVGFTARSKEKLNETKEYFKKLGIDGFVNLLTCSDNYNPQKYPDAKDSNALKFLPTWIFALPTYEGLRLSLSESSRLEYSEKKPISWDEHIGKVKLRNEKIDIDVNMTSGLNVVIGGSSSGKTLFVDALYKTIKKEKISEAYSEFGLETLEIENPSGRCPYYIDQNFISNTLFSNESVKKIDIIKSLFPSEEELNGKNKKVLDEIHEDIHNLINAISDIEGIQEQLLRIMNIQSLAYSGEIEKNIVECLKNNITEREKLILGDNEYVKLKDDIDDVEKFLFSHPFCSNLHDEFEKIKNELNKAYKISQFEMKIFEIINNEETKEKERLRENDTERQTKENEKKKLLELIQKYITCMKVFYCEIDKISKYDYVNSTKDIDINGNKLNIKNNFVVNEAILIEIINNCIMKKCKKEKISEFLPEDLFIKNCQKKIIKNNDYGDLEKYIFDQINDLTKIEYKIITSNGKDFSELSPGWQTAVLLEFIIGYDKDTAPLIIDQPEDNLATSYINQGLIKILKKMKRSKQIIVVSHNATIPMLGDAQNIILCENKDNKIIIRSQKMEGLLDGKYMVDYIAEITDGGKSSIKKRIKKYDFKTFKE